MLNDTKLDEALGVAFDIVGDEEFEVIRTDNFFKAEAKLLLCESDIKWVILEQDKFFSIGLRLLNEGLKIVSGEIIKVNIIFISSYKQERINQKADVKLTLF
jgi:hypothetical protein